MSIRLKTLCAVLVLSLAAAVLPAAAQDKMGRMDARKPAMKSGKMMHGKMAKGKMHHGKMAKHKMHHTRMAHHKMSGGKMMNAKKSGKMGAMKDTKGKM